MSGVEIIRAIQSVSNPVLDQISLLITDLHHENFYLLVMPLLFWLYDKRFTRYLTSILFLGLWANDAMKHLFGTARPTPDQVRVVRPETSPAFPSGHSMNPLMFWGAIALYARRTWLTVALSALIFVIGFSRLYLGVHWPLDVVGGWAIGALMLWGFEATRSFWEGERLPLHTRLLLAIAIPLGMLALFREGVAWNTPGDLAGHTWVIIGAYMGAWAGAVLEEEYVGFDPRRGGLGAHALKVLLGFVLLFGAKEGLKLVLPDIALGDLVRYTVVGMMLTLVAPWIFHRFVTRVPVGRSVAR